MSNKQLRTLRATSLGTWFPIDSAIWMMAVTVGAWARFDFNVNYLTARVALLTLVAPLAVLIAGLVTGLYMRRFLPASFDEVSALGISNVLVWAMLQLCTVLAPSTFAARSIPLLASAFGLLGMWAARFVVRTLASPGQQGKRVIVFGAGVAGRQLIRQLKEDPTSAYTPVAALDDDPSKRGLQLSGVRVRGGRRDIANLAADARATTLIIAIPTADADLIRELKVRANGAGLQVLILPALDELMNRVVAPGDLREINVNDLLGRQPISLDENAIRSQIAGKRVLVTGAGGSIGSELCRQIYRFEPAALVMLDRDESALHAVQLSIEGHAMLDTDNLVLADIRDRPALHRIFSYHNPEIVFHAAALKHLPLLERHPIENSGSRTSWAPGTYLRQPPPLVCKPSSTYLLTRQPTQPAYWATANGLPNDLLQPWQTMQQGHMFRFDLATCLDLGGQF